LPELKATVALVYIASATWGEDENPPRRRVLAVIALGDGAMFGSRVSIRSWRSYGKIEDCKQPIRRKVGEVT